MLIEFSVANFRSIRDRQVLSLVANNKDKNLPVNVIDIQAPGLANTKLLKSVVVYGANASGKSNLFKAAVFANHLVLNSAAAIKPGEATGRVPFLLDPTYKDKPTEFELLFIHDGTRYQYGFSVDERRIREEWLVAYPLGQPQRWFTRIFISETQKYEWKFSSKLKGDKRSLSEKTRENALFLSMGAQFDHEQLTAVYNWFKKCFRFLDFSVFNDTATSTGVRTFTIKLVERNENMRRAVKQLLSRADLGIQDIKIEHIPVDDIEFPDGFSDELRKRVLDDLGLSESQVPEPRCLHRSADADSFVEFSEHDESGGTIKLFQMLGPWLYTLAEGCTLLVDEIGANMHPLLVRDLLKILHHRKLDSSGAQVVFTTHDTTLMDTRLFRRDQIWFTEKDKSGATSLYPLTDFKPRESEALQKGYLAGRYGAIPFLKGEFAL